jgi:hypothetical protein
LLKALPTRKSIVVLEYQDEVISASTVCSGNGERCFALSDHPDGGNAGCGFNERRVAFGRFPGHGKPVLL